MTTKEKQVRERVVEAYLKAQVRQAGGATKKQRGINDPDQLVIWPPTNDTSDDTPWSTRYAWVETKAPGKKPRPGQAREHKRLRDLGCTVLVIDTKAKVDEYVEANR